MTISKDGSLLKQQPFNNEDELQKLIFMNPYLLQNENDLQYYPLGREVIIPPAGKLDILFLEENGTLIAVEVKLSKNSQSRREVVAQIFDYVSSLSSLTYYDLDEILKGKLEETSLLIDEENSLPKIINSQLKSGYIKLFIAVDESNEDLERIMYFICERTNLDVRLIEISKYDHGNILVPKIIIERSDVLQTQINNYKLNTVFEEIVDYYNSNSPDEYKTNTNKKHYRQIKHPNWPTGIHYEFLDKKRINSIGVELHIESDKFRYLSNIFNTFTNITINNKSITYDNTWSKNRGRIFINYEYSAGKELIAKSMIEFINNTHETISKELIKSKDMSSM